MTFSTEVSLMLMTNSLLTEGRILRMTCGMMTLNIVCEWVMPMLIAPSN